MSDFALSWNGTSADMSMLDDDLREERSLETSLILSLFTDRADDDSDGHEGYWADEFADGQDGPMGSRLWKLDRASAGDSLELDADTYIREALKWMIDARVASGFSIEFDRPNAGTLYVRLTVHRPNDAASSFRFAYLWDSLA